MEREDVMTPQGVQRLLRSAGKFLFALVAASATTWIGHADTPPTATTSPTPTPAAATTRSSPELSVAEAIRRALDHNPDIAIIRRQHGIAAASVITARTYPFNPVATSYVWYDNGPAAAGVTNHVFNEHIVRLDLEIRGQGQHRRTAACAALTRTDWEIAAQEVTLAVRVVRACDLLAYRREKLLLVDEGARLLEQSTEQLGKLVEQGKANRADLLLARADIADLRTARAPAYNQYVAAWYDLRRLLGMVDEPLDNIRDSLASALRPQTANLVQTALERRPDLHAVEVAVQEADARLRLEVANRFGNPSVGPAFEYNETSAYFIGAAFNYPIPVLNTHRGEILLRQAERDRAVAALEATEMHVRQDVQAAVARLDNAAGVVDAYRNRTLPALEEARKGIDQLFAQGEPGVDVSRVTGVRQRQLKARDFYLDALYELSQARADLATAVGDPSLALVEPRIPRQAGP
jgi:cobalt-zinc-cadmium efflux system outer membrane protein